MLLPRVDAEENHRSLYRIAAWAGASVYSDPEYQPTMTMPASVPLGISSGLAQLPIG